LRLFAILIWYDESPTWLGSMITSLQRIGVDHLIAIDGAFRHYDGDARSNSVQAEAIHLACDAADIGLTMERPQYKMWTEVEKRAYAFKLFECMSEKWVDWCLVIDGDEVIAEGSPAIKHELTETGLDVANALLWETVDPDTDVGKNNTPKTMQIYHTIPNDTVYTHFQTRFWRCIDNMRLGHTHFDYLGDRDGITYRLRGDLVGDKETYPLAAHVLNLDTPVAIQHRDWWRTAIRRQTKLEYYDLRDRIGLEEKRES
jgi:hypothetical protein